MIDCSAKLAAKRVGIEYWLHRSKTLFRAVQGVDLTVRPGEFLAQDFFSAPVRGADEIGRPLERDLQVLDLAEIALEHAAGLVRGLDHHIEEGGAEHGATGLPAAMPKVKTAPA